ncbi:MAG TPA: M36 family metallopeptidase [bacterium]|nr:M36 family metallopeptidase [bacterium]
MEDLSELLTQPGEGQPDFLPDPHVIETSAGERIVHVQQHRLGIPVFKASRQVLFGEDGAVREVTGDHVPLPDGLDPVPELAARDAALAAALHVAAASSRKVSGRRPRIEARHRQANRLTFLAKPPFGRMKAHLTWFFTGDAARLGWRVALGLPDGEGEFEVVVAADVTERTPAVLYCRRQDACVAATGSVFRYSPDEQGAAPADFPPPLAEYPSYRPAGVPLDFRPTWVASRSTKGPAADAQLGSRRLKGKKEGGRVLFQVADNLSWEQWLLNPFYVCNFLHDFFLLFGFDSSAGNLEGDDFLRILVSTSQGGSRLIPAGDGDSCEMKLGLAGPVHSALDADVVIHEYVHALVERLVGGTNNVGMMVRPQSRGLAEGYCDYFALTIQNYARRREGREERFVFGAYSTQDSVKGHRGQAYDDAFSGTYGDLGQGRFIEQHAVGEIWCFALLQLNRAFGRLLGDRARGDEIGWLVVVDSIKKLPTGQDAPSFVEARQRLYEALDAHRGKLLTLEEHDDLAREARKVFAARGLGTGATSAGASLSGIHEDLTGGA